jgi:S-adenosylmethionine:tRNA ribosyltransferase-isomerase
LPGDLWVVEPRGIRAQPGELLSIGKRATARLLVPYLDSQRLWVAAFDTDVNMLMAWYGRPIAYPYVRGRWPLEMYQTVYAGPPGSAEMPSAGRAFTPRVLDALGKRGVVLAPLLLHTGVASPEAHEPPYEEYFRVSEETARRINAAHAEGRRVVAVGTTVVRALETVSDASGRVSAGEGWTCTVITPERRVRAVDGLLTGFHEPRASHLLMLEAIAGRDHLQVAYAEALRQRYLWHEFGDMHLIL